MPTAIPTTSLHPVLEPIELGSLALANRVVLAPMSRVSAEPDGRPTRRMADYYEEFAREGFGLVVTEGTYTDAAFARSYASQPGLVTGSHVEGWRAVTEAVHAHAVPIVAQLMHAGALSQVLARTAGPSSVQPAGEKMPEYGGSGPYPLPKEMTDGDIETAVAGFALAALRAREAGFDGVEIHAANGYLLDQFISRSTNRRRDPYGGGPAERARLTCEVAAAVRAAVGDGFVVGVRLSQTKVNDLDYRWAGRGEAEPILTAVAESDVDYLHIASEGRDWQAAGEIEPGLTLTRLARELTGLPVIANGGMHDPRQARRVLAEGHGDLVSLGRGALAAPDWIRRVRNGAGSVAFDRSMLHPRATLENQDRWRAAHAGGAGQPVGDA